MLRLFFFFWIVLGMFSCASKTTSQEEVFSPLPQKENNDYTLKVKYLDELIKENPKSAEYYYERAKLYIRLKKELQALSDIRSAIALDSTQAQYHFHAAELYAQIDETENAFRSAQKALQMKTTEASIYRLLGKLEHKRQHYDASLHYFATLQKYEPQDAEVLYYKSLNFIRKKDTLQSIENIKKAIQLKPDYVEAHVQFAHIFTGGYRNSKNAIAILHEAIRKCGEKSVLYMEQGNFYDKIHKKDSAMVCYAKAYSLDTTQWQPALKLGFYFLQLRNYPQSENYLKITHRLQPDNKTANYLLGFLYEYYIENWRLAQRHYQRAFDADQQSADLLKAINRIKKKIDYEEYKKSPEYLLDLMRRKEAEQKRIQDSLRTIQKQDSTAH